MQNWVKDMSAYVKSIDPAHLVMVSSWGYFGKSTPELQPQNPYDLTWRGIGNNAGVSTCPSCHTAPFSICATGLQPQNAFHQTRRSTKNGAGVNSLHIFDAVLALPV